MKIIVFAALMVLLGAAQLAITISGWQSNPPRITDNDPSPGPTRWH